MAEALTFKQAAVKRGFDLAAAAAGLLITSPLLVVGWLAAAVSTREGGIFRQQRVGRHGEVFTVFKLRSMRSVGGASSMVTSSDDARITRAGAWLRRFKVDELPQLYNVLVGDMSLVGPRPDVPGFADRLTGDDRLMLTVRPGITGPASLAYRHEEQVLAGAADPERYNREVLWPDKVRINCDYVRNWSMLGDVHYLIETLASIFRRHEEVGA